MAGDTNGFGKQSKFAFHGLIKSGSRRLQAPMNAKPHKGVKVVDGQPQVLAIPPGLKSLNLAPRASREGCRSVLCFNGTCS